jgi:seryl-tRNA synthetase
MSIENQFQQWVSIDNQLKSLNEKIKELRERKNKLTENITTYASNNNLSEKIVKIDNDKLKITNIRTAEPLTFKYIAKTLGEVIKNESQVDLILEHLKNKRQIKTVPEIKRLYNN